MSRDAETGVCHARCQSVCLAPARFRVVWLVEQIDSAETILRRSNAPINHAL
jgi:hypothetical protein